MPIVAQHYDDQQHDDSMALICIELAHLLMPSTQPNANLHPGHFLSSTGLDLYRYHSGISA